MLRLVRSLAPCLALIGLLLAPSAASAGSSGTVSPAPITAAQLLGPGGDVALSPNGKTLAFAQQDSHGVYQLYTSAPDGSGKVCISCSVTPARNAVSPVWTPDGNYLLVQHEIPYSLPLLIGANGQGWATEMEENGVWTDLVAVTPDGAHWYDLSSDPSIHNAMSIHVSRDGKHVAWSHLTAAAGLNDPWGTYALMEGDLVVTNAVPALTNVRNVTPKMPGSFFEAHGFSPDGTHLLFASDSGATWLWMMNIWSLDLASGQATNLTKGITWNEHADYTPDGKAIVYFSSNGGTGTLTGELWMMAPDGSQKQQITHFNTPGFPESSTQAGMPLGPAFSPGGSQLFLTYQVANGYPARQMWTLRCSVACAG